MNLNAKSKLPPVKSTFSKFSSESIVPSTVAISRSKSPIRSINLVSHKSQTPNIEISADVLKTQQMATRGTFNNRANFSDWSEADKGEIQNLQSHFNIQDTMKEESIINQKSVINDLQSMFNQLISKQEFDPLVDELTVFNLDDVQTNYPPAKDKSGAYNYELVDIAYDNILQFMNENKADQALIKTLKGIQTFYNYFIKSKPTQNKAQEEAIQRLDTEYQDLLSRYNASLLQNQSQANIIEDLQKTIKKQKDNESSLRTKVLQLNYEFENMSKELAGQKANTETLDENLTIALTKNEDYLTRIKRVQFSLSKQRIILNKMTVQYDTAVLNMRTEQEIRETIQQKYNVIELENRKFKEELDQMVINLQETQTEMEHLRKQKVQIQTVKPKEDIENIEAKTLKPQFLQGISTLVAISRIHPDDLTNLGIQAQGIKGLMTFFSSAANSRSIMQFINGVKSQIITQMPTNQPSKGTQTVVCKVTEIVQEKQVIPQLPVEEKFDILQEQEQILALEQKKVVTMIDKFNEATKKEEEKIEIMQQQLLQDSNFMGDQVQKSPSLANLNKGLGNSLTSNLSQVQINNQFSSSKLTGILEPQQNFDDEYNEGSDEYASSVSVKQQAENKVSSKDKIICHDVGINVMQECYEFGTITGPIILRNKLFPLLFTIPQFYSLQLFFENENIRLLDQATSEQEQNLLIVQDNFNMESLTKGSKFGQEQSYIDIKKITVGKQTQIDEVLTNNIEIQTILQELPMDKLEKQELENKIDDLLDDIFNMQVQNTTLQEGLDMASEQLTSQLNILNLIKEADTDMKQIKKAINEQNNINTTQLIQNLTSHVNKREKLYNVDEQIEDTKKFIQQKEEKQSKVQKQRNQLISKKQAKNSVKTTKKNSTLIQQSDKYKQSNLNINNIQQNNSQNLLSQKSEKVIVTNTKNQFPDKINKPDFIQNQDSIMNQQQVNDKNQNVQNIGNDIDNGDEIKVKDINSISSKFQQILNDDNVEFINSKNVTLERLDKSVQSQIVRCKAKDVQTLINDIQATTQTDFLPEKVFKQAVENDQVALVECQSLGIQVETNKEGINVSTQKTEEQEQGQISNLLQSNPEEQFINIKDRLLNSDFTKQQIIKHDNQVQLDLQRKLIISQKQKTILTNIRTQNLSGLLGFDFNGLEQKTIEQKSSLRQKLFKNSLLVEQLSTQEKDLMQKQKGFLNKNVVNTRAQILSIIQNYNQSSQKSLIDEQLQKRLESLQKIQSESKVISIDANSSAKKKQNMMKMQVNMFQHGKYQTLIPKLDIQQRFQVNQFFQLKKTKVVKFQKYGIQFYDDGDNKTISFTPCLLGIKYPDIYFETHNLDNLPQIITQTLKLCELECSSFQQPSALQVKTILPNLLEKITHISLQSLGQFTTLPIFFGLIQQFSGNHIEIVKIYGRNYIKLPIQNIQLKSCNWLLKTIDLIFTDRFKASPQQVFCQSNQSVFFTEGSQKRAFSVYSTGTYSFEEMVYFPFFIVKWAINRYKIKSLILQFLFSFVVTLVYFSEQNDDLFILKNFLFYDQFSYEVGDIFLVYIRLRQFFDLSCLTQNQNIQLESLAHCIELMFQNWPIQRKTSLLDIFCSIADKINRVEIPVISVIPVLLQSFSSYRQAQYQMISSKLPMNYASFKQILKTGNINIQDVEVASFLCAQDDKIFDIQHAQITASQLQDIFVVTEMGRFLCLNKDLEKLIVDQKIKDETQMIQEVQKDAEETIEKVLNELVMIKVDHAKIQQIYIHIQEKVSEIHSNIVVYDVNSLRISQREFFNQMIDIFSEFLEEGIKERINVAIIDILNNEINKKILM